MPAEWEVEGVGKGAGRRPRLWEASPLSCFHLLRV
jgi:hypothetical protein